MTTKILTLIASMILSPCIAGAVADCRIVEYPDHLEATCEDIAVTTTSRSVVSGTNKGDRKSSAELTAVAPMRKAELQSNDKIRERAVKETVPKQRRRSESAIEAAKAARTELILGSRQ